MSLERLLGLKEEERLVMVARAAVVTVVPAFFLAAILIGAVGFFLTPILRLEVLGYVIIGVVSVLALAIGLGQLMRWRGTALALTERRLFVVRRSGLFERNVAELPLSKISAVSYQVKGLLPTVFGYGTLLVATAASENPLAMSRLPHPDRLQAIIAETLEQHSKGPGDFGEMLHAVSRLTDSQLEMLREEIDRARRHRSGAEGPDVIPV
jgi:membrane protein YdbS with pleckstrin-like domain